MLNMNLMLLPSPQGFALQRYQIFILRLQALLELYEAHLHGGANEAASAMLSQWNNPDIAEEELLKMLSQKQLVMGFGHAVYTESDPRNEVIKEWSKKLSIEVNDKHLI